MLSDRHNVVQFVPEDLVEVLTQETYDSAGSQRGNWRPHQRKGELLGTECKERSQDHFRRREGFRVWYYRKI